MVCDNRVLPPFAVVYDSGNTVILSILEVIEARYTYTASSTDLTPPSDHKLEFLAGGAYLPPRQDSDIVPHSIS